MKTFAAQLNVQFEAHDDEEAREILKTLSEIVSSGIFKVTADTSNLEEL